MLPRHLRLRNVWLYQILWSLHASNRYITIGKSCPIILKPFLFWDMTWLARLLWNQLEKIYWCRKIFHQQNPSRRLTLSINRFVNLTATVCLQGDLSQCQEQWRAERGLALLLKHCVDLTSSGCSQFLRGRNQGFLFSMGQFTHVYLHQKHQPKNKVLAPHNAYLKPFHSQHPKRLQEHKLRVQFVETIQYTGKAFPENKFYSSIAGHCRIVTWEGLATETQMWTNCPAQRKKN